MIVNISRIKEFQTCPHKYRRRYEEGVAEAIPSLNLTFGSAIHEGLRAHYMGEDAAEAYLASIPDDHPDKLYGLTMLAAYAKRWAQEDREWRVLAAEEAWECHIGPHTIVGRPDLVIEREEGVYHVQHKTLNKYKGFDAYAQAYELDWHEPAYALAAIERGYGDRYRGTILNILRKTNEPSFYRTRIVIDEWKLKNFKQDVTQVIALMYRSERPRNPQSCFNYNTKCFLHAECWGMDFGQMEWGEREPDYVDERRRDESP